jgi:hypothetical protein
MQSSTALTRLDHLISRLLFIKPISADQPQAAQAAGEAAAGVQRATRTYNLSLMLSAGRCVIQYVVLPFVLPLVGVAGEAATGISLAINLVAILAIIASVRRLWQINYARKWAYLCVAAGALVFIVFFILFDLHLIA